MEQPGKAFPSSDPSLSGETTGAVRSSCAAINQVLPRDICLGVIVPQIPRDGVIVDVELQPLGDVAEQAFLDELLGQIAQIHVFVDLDVEIIRARVVIEIVSALAPRQDHAQLVVVVPDLTSRKIRANIALA